ncbi:glycosyltransferase [Humibacter sp. BT305]|nr:glycosyltransferase [Humibacter sp. BT305]
MRVLCSFVGGAGHLVPQLPLLEALRDAGHDLAVLAGRSSGTASAPAGLFRRTMARPDGRTRSDGDISPLLPLDREHEIAAVADHFAGPAALRSVAAIGGELDGIDVVVCDELDFGAMAAAARARIPVVVVSVIVSGALVRPALLESALERLRLELGLAEPIHPQGDLFVVPFVPRMRNPDFPAPPHTEWMRPAEGSPSPRDGSIVATLGTEFNTESGDLFDRILAALAEIDAPAVVAVGRDLDPARFGPQPPHVRVERYVHLAEVVGRADVVLHHGGSGLFMECVLGGTPQIVLPMGADQPFTADRVRALGLGAVLDAVSATPAELRAVVESVRADVATRTRVATLRAETLRLPPPVVAVRAVEDLVARR